MKTNDPIDTKKSVIFKEVKIIKENENFFLEFNYLNKSKIGGSGQLMTENTKRKFPVDIEWDKPELGNKFVSCKGRSQHELAAIKSDYDSKILNLQNQLDGFKEKFDKEFGDLYNKQHTQSDCRLLQSNPYVSAVQVIDMEGTKVCLVTRKGDTDNFIDYGGDDAGVQAVAREWSRAFQPGKQGACPSGWLQYSYCSALQDTSRSFGIPGGTRSYQLSGRSFSCSPITYVWYRHDTSSGNMNVNGQIDGGPSAVVAYAGSLKDDGDDRRHKVARTIVTQTACY